MGRGSNNYNSRRIKSSSSRSSVNFVEDGNDKDGGAAIDNTLSVSVGMDVSRERRCGSFDRRKVQRRQLFPT